MVLGNDEKLRMDLEKSNPSEIEELVQDNDSQSVEDVLDEYDEIHEDIGIITEEEDSVPEEDVFEDNIIEEQQEEPSEMDRLYDSNIYDSPEEVVVVVDDPFVVAYEEEGSSRFPMPVINKKTIPDSSSLNHCQFCGLEFRFRTPLMVHYQSEHPGEQYTCESCGRCFTAAQTWRAHNCDQNRGSFCCDICKKVFTHRNLLRAHEKTHNESQYTCEICNKEFVQKYKYTTHLKRHSEIREFQCDQCQTGFKERRELVRHIRIVHTDQKSFQCDRCPRSFALRYMLTRHMQSHTGARPHKCTVCGQNLSSNNALKHHMFTHTGEKPYTCHYCPAEFRIKVNLTRHLKEHEEDNVQQQEVEEEELMG